MMTFRSTAVLVALSMLIGCPAEQVGEPIPDDCIVAIDAGEQQFTCSDLVFDVSVPEACLASACGLILDVHGLTMSAAQQDKNTDMRELGREHGYVVVQPNAPRVDSIPSWTPESDDPRVHDFLQRAIEVYGIDPDRVHMTGFSQGGLMTWRFVCRHADLLASAAPAAAGGSQMGEACEEMETPGCAFEGADRPSREMDILFMHGTTDALVDVQCAWAQRDAVVEAWSMDGPQDVAGDELHVWSRYQSSQGSVFEFVQHDYAAASPLLDGHCFPGSDDHEVTEEGQILSYGCEEDCAFAWGEEVMAFFRDHPRR